MKPNSWTPKATGAGILLTLPLAAILSLPLKAAEPTIVTLTQTPCQFVEIEAKDHGFKSTRKADCEKINAKTAEERLGKSKVLKLKAGKHIFRVTNKNVPYDLGFYLRGAGIYGRISLPKVSGGGLAPGVTKDYAINLEPGTYLYSCPLNTTPDYTIIVKG